MALIKEITASRSVKMNLGNYESVDFFLSMKAELDEFDDPAVETEELQAKVDAATIQQVRRAYRARGKKVSLAALCKQHGLSLHDDGE